MKYEFLICFSCYSAADRTSKAHLTYYATHSRASAWIVGLIFGYILFCLNGRRIAISKVFNNMNLINFFIEQICVYQKPFYSAIQKKTDENVYMTQTTRTLHVLYTLSVENVYVSCNWVHVHVFSVFFFTRVVTLSLKVVHSSFTWH